MKTKKYYSEFYLEEKRITIKECRKIKGFTSEHNFLKNLAAFPGCTVTKKLSINNKILTIKVHNLSKKYLFE